MVNNFNLIEPLLKFDDEGKNFYFIQVLQRKKDNKEDKVNGSNNNSRLIKAYYIESQSHLDFVKPEIIELCKLFNARAGINLNRRNFEKMSFQLLRKVTDQIMNKSYDKSYKAYPSVVGAYNHESDKRWIVDIDEDYLNKFDIIKMVLNHKDLDPVGEKIIAEIPSKNGVHLITKPFNLKRWRESLIVRINNLNNIEIHKNNPTNLYIP